MVWKLIQKLLEFFTKGDIENKTEIHSSNSDEQDNQRPYTLP